MNCGYTAPGCVNPPEKFTTSVSSSTTCSGTETSLVMVTVTIPRPSINSGGLVAAEAHGNDGMSFLDRTAS
jgi:hypothetical protein